MNNLKIALFIFTTFTLSSHIYSAAPVTHIYFAEQFIKKCKPNYTTKEKAMFMRGTLWPDIRYLARIPRTKTHVKNVTLPEIIKTEDSFTAGKLFHSFVDEQREKIAEREKVYDLLTLVPEKQKSRFLKAIEDELFYKDINIKESIAALKDFDKAERKGGIAMYDVRAWHKHLTTYLKQSPADLLHERVKQKRGFFHFSSVQVSLASTLLDDCITNKNMLAYVQKLRTGLNSLLKC